MLFEKGVLLFEEKAPLFEWRFLLVEKGVLLFKREFFYY
jgi:hypothetical protein